MFIGRPDERQLRRVSAPAGDSVVRGGSVRDGNQFGVELRSEYDSDLAAEPVLNEKTGCKARGSGPNVGY